MEVYVFNADRHPFIRKARCYVCFRALLTEHFLPRDALLAWYGIRCVCMCSYVRHKPVVHQWLNV